MASPTGTARMPTQGSWRPLVVMSVSAPAPDRSTVLRAEAGRHAVGDDLDDRADRGAALADAVEVALEERGLVLVRTEERIARDLVPVPFVAIDPVRAHLHQRAAHLDAGQDLSRDGAG